MTISADRRVFTKISVLAAVLVGVLPALIFFGRVVIGIVAVSALAGVLSSGDFRSIWRRTRTVLVSPLGLAIGATFVLFLPSLVASPDPVHSFETIVRSALFLGAAVVFWRFLADDAARSVLAIKSFLIAAIVGSALAATAILLLPDIYLITHLKTELPPTIVLAYKQTGSAAILMFPLSCYGAWRLDGRWRWLAVAVAAALVAVMLLTGNRAGTAGLVGALLVAAVAVAYRRRQMKLIAFALVGFVAFGVAALTWNAEQRAEMEVPPGTRTFMPDWIIDWHRQHIWITTWEIGARHPWLGSGVNEIDAWPSANEMIGTTTARAISFHPHNWILEIGAETGLISLAWMLCILAIIHWKLLSYYHRSGSPEILTAITVSAGYWISGLFNFSYWSSWWMVTFYATMALALAAAPFPSPQEPNAGR